MLYKIKKILLCQKIANLKIGITEKKLLYQASYYSFHTIINKYPNAKQILILCGFDDNSYIGYNIAIHAARKHDCYITIYSMYSEKYLPNSILDIISNIRNYKNIIFTTNINNNKKNYDIIIDTLLGIKTKININPNIIESINNKNIPIISIDNPSGLDADTGGVFNACCIRATITITFIGLKLGFMMSHGPDYCGKIIFHDLRLKNVMKNIIPSARILHKNNIYGLIKKRTRNSHKGNFGHVIIIGGGHGMLGAAYLAAKSALKVGCGMVTILTRPEYYNILFSCLPEAMIYGISNIEQCQILMQKATVCVIGPGLGTDQWAKDILNIALAIQLPKVIDASALRILAKYPKYNDSWILTPHPGEAADLLNSTTENIQYDRYKSVRKIQKKYGGIIILKGLGTLIQTNNTTYLCKLGNPIMSICGMGDVLSGVLGGLLAHGLSLENAAKIGVWIHSNAADQAANIHGELGLLASELIPYINYQINNIYR